MSESKGFADDAEDRGMPLFANLPVSILEIHAKQESMPRFDPDYRRSVSRHRHIAEETFNVVLIATIVEN